MPGGSNEEIAIYGKPDEGVREALAIEVDTSLPAQRVVPVLSNSKPGGITQSDAARQWPRTDSQHLARWCKDKGIECALSSRANRIRTLSSSASIVLPHRVLDGWLLTSLDEVREIAHQWLQSYNQERPHDAQGSLPPAVFREKLLVGENSTSQLST